MSRLRAKTAILDLRTNPTVYRLIKSFVLHIFGIDIGGRVGVTKDELLARFAVYYSGNFNLGRPLTFYASLAADAAEREYAVRVKRGLLIGVMLLLASAAGAGQNCSIPGNAGASQASTVQPPRNLQTYSASLTIDLRDKLQVQQQAWRAVAKKKGTPTKQPLTPTQGYVRCMLAGSGDVLRFGCASGFRPLNPAQTPLNANGFIEDTPDTTGTTLQPDAVNTITYDCVRAAVAPRHKPVAKK